MSNEESVVRVADGKYEVRHSNGTGLRALRHGEPWRDLTGDGLVLALVHRIEELEEAATLRQQAARVDEDMVERAASAFMRVRGLGMARPWEGMLESSRESYRPAFRAALEAALSAQPAERQGETPAYWAAVSDDGEIVVAYPTDDGNNGEASRAECNGYINDALLNDRALLHLTALYTHPAAPVGVPDGWHREWRGSLTLAAETLEVESEHMVEGGQDAESRRMKRAATVIRSLLAAAPSAPQGVE